MNNNIEKIDTLIKNDEYFIPGNYSSHTQEVIMCVFCYEFQNIDKINETLNIKWITLNKYFDNLNIAFTIKSFLKYNRPYDKFKFNKNYSKKYSNSYYDCNTYSYLVISIFTEIMLRPSESYTFTHNKCYYNKYCVCENEGINQHKYIHVSLPKKNPHRKHYICVPCTYKSLQSVKNNLDFNTDKYILSEDKLSYTHENNTIPICNCFKYGINENNICINMLCTTYEPHIDIPYKEFDISSGPPCGKHCIQYNKLHI
uniref:Uncharacterized protein n=1 Tax=viral metagenome TaxID=1070528 RepID=A0A6C0H815_9ZZZZ